MKKTPYEQAGMVDPMLTNAQGMPVDPMQAIQPMQPVNVGMPGSTVIPAGVGHNMQQPVQAGQRMLNPIAPMAMKGDLDKDGKMSSYEQARQTAIEKNMSPMKQTGIPPAKDVIGKIYPAGRDSTTNEKMYVRGEKKGYTPETMKLFQKGIEKEQDNRISQGKPIHTGGYNPSSFRQNGKVEKVGAVTGGIQKSNEGPIVRTRGAGRANPHATFTAFDGSAIKLPSVQQQVDKYDKQVTDEKAKKRLIQAYKSTK